MEEVLARIISFVALLLISSSYFVSKKNYLLFQSLGMVALALSYLLTKEFFAMVALWIGLARALTFFVYEKGQKEAPLSLSFLFAGLTLLAYLVVNLGIQKTAKPEDLLYLAAKVFFAFTFRIRNLKTLRFVTLIPTTLAVIYNFLCNTTVFVILSTLFELGAVIVAIFRYHVFGAKKSETPKREDEM